MLILNATITTCAEMTKATKDYVPHESLPL